MNRKLLVVVAAVLLVLALWRIIGSFGGGDSTDLEKREAVRLFVCYGCGFAEPAEGPAIQQRYNDHQVGGGGPYGPAFGCSSCGEIKAQLVTVDFKTRAFACLECGKTWPRNISDLLRAAKEGGVRLARSGELQVRCPDCDTFTCVMIDPATAQDE